MKSAVAHTATEPEVPELGLSCVPAHVLNMVRGERANILPIKTLVVFYTLIDGIEKTIKTLKEKCRPAIISRRNEGKPSGAENQHREFVYRIPAREIRLTVQERFERQPDLEKLEALLKAKDLWQYASTTAVDLNKVDGLVMTGLLTAEEFANASNAPKTTYALIAKIHPKIQQ